MNINKLNLIPLSLASLTILTGTILVSSIVSADDSVIDEINITVPVSCTLSGTGMDSHNANINNGLYVPDIGTTTLHAFCNDNEGFAIYAAGYTNNEVGGTNGNKLVGTTASGNATIESGIATTAGNPDVSNWAMKLAIAQDSGDITGTNAFTIDSAPNVALPSQAESGATQAPFSSYHVVPNEYAKVAHKNSATDMTDTTGGVKLTTTYAAYISKTQPADTYTGQVIYTLVHPASHVAPGALTPPTSCTTPVPGLKYMQDLTSSNKATILSSMTEDSQYYLADKRDDKTYCVAKLRDGNLWMTQNLDHDIVTDGSVVYDDTTTDLGWNSSTNTYDAASWTPASATKATSDATWTTGSAGSTIPESYDPGELYWNGELYPTDSVSCEAAGGAWNYDEEYCYNLNLTSSTGNSHYHLGNYYNWTSAIAMNDSSGYTANNTDVNQSICPTGWTLPRSGNNTSSGSFKYLFEQYGWSSYQIINPNVWDTAIKLPLAGNWYGSLHYVGDMGDFWLSVVYDSNSAYNAGAKFVGYVGPNNINVRYYGISVRCLAR